MKNKQTPRQKRYWFMMLLTSLLLCSTTIQPANAQFGGPIGGPIFNPPPPPTIIPGEECCSCPERVKEVSEQEFETGSPTRSTVPRIGNHIASELAAQRIWMISIFWEDNVLPAMMLMSEQITATAMKQVQIIGSFFDARQKMQTQQVLQKIRAQTHKNYQPSVGMCEFGSTVKSLAASERRGEYNAYVLSQRSQDRHLGQAFTAAKEGALSDITFRLEQFRENYCDSADNNNALNDLCSGGGDRNRYNKDIDYVRTLGAPATIDVNFTDSFIRNDEEDLFALASNLYGHRVLYRFGSKKAQALGEDTNGSLNDAQKNYMDMRAYLAKRSVAENSFNAIAALKSAGTEGSKDYLMAILEEMGISTQRNTSSADPRSDAEKILGEQPSYYAQMEVLGKRIYQNPDFYTNLYDKPANVERKQVAMQAIGLMQKFDLFKSYLRQEASMSILLEMALINEQNDAVKNQSNISKASGRTSDGTPTP